MGTKYKIVSYILVLVVFMTSITLLKSSLIFANVDQLSGKTYLFRANRMVKHPKVKLPSQNIQEKEYKKSADYLMIYHLEFSADGKTVSIKAPGSNKIICSGQKMTDDNKVVRYDLNKGTYAGGRVIVWLDNKNLTAELTLYGSGFPILISFRGDLQKS